MPGPKSGMKMPVPELAVESHTAIEALAEAMSYQFRRDMRKLLHDELKHFFGDSKGRHSPHELRENWCSESSVASSVGVRLPSNPLKHQVVSYTSMHQKKAQPCPRSALQALEARTKVPRLNSKMVSIFSRIKNRERGSTLRPLVTDNNSDESPSDDDGGTSGHVCRRSTAKFISDTAKNMLFTPLAECISASLIVLYAVFLGIEIEYKTRFQGAVIMYSVWVHSVFIICFFLELTLKAIAFGKDLLYGADMFWNMFDWALAVEMLLDLYGTRIVNFGPLRLLRILRIVRLTRLLRVVGELRTIVVSLAFSIRSVSWALLLLFLLIYSGAMCITQAVYEYTEKSKHSDKSQEYKELLYWFGTLSRTIVTLFECIASGVSWDEALRPLTDQIGSLAGFALCCFIAFTLFAMLNVITGVVLETASIYTRDEQDKEMAENICRALSLTGDDPAREIDYAEFELSSHSGEMKKYFDAIDVDETEAQFVFELIDTDDSGGLSVVELITALMRLRGNSRAIQLALVLRESRLMKSLVLKDGQILETLASDVLLMHQMLERFIQATGYDVLEQCPQSAAASRAGSHTIGAWPGGALNEVPPPKKPAMMV